MVFGDFRVSPDTPTFMLGDFRVSPDTLPSYKLIYLGEGVCVCVQNCGFRSPGSV